jgi:hypothetical protein
MVDCYWSLMVVTGGVRSIPLFLGVGGTPIVFG